MHGGEGVEALFLQALALLALAVVFVAAAARAGLSPILGYFAAGALVGPILGGVAETEAVFRFSEFGVTLLLFVIGLELQPSKLWAMRTEIFGLGLAQVLVSGGALALAAFAVGLSAPASAVVGFGLALSSTALVMQLLAERRELATPLGRSAFSVLLLQDLAIVPLLILVGLLSPGGENLPLAERAAGVGLAAAAVLAVIVAGRFLVNPLFGLLARARAPEIMTAAALAIVIGASYLMSTVGLSYGAGAFLAGVVLAESHYRHELEADIEPFRGLFLGLFFMAVGMSLDLAIVWRNWQTIAAVTLAAMSLKALTIFAVARLFGKGGREAGALGLLLAQHGEFGFVLFATAVAAGLFDAKTGSILVAVVTLSMILAPFAPRLLGLLGTPRRRTLEESFEDAGGRAVIVGFGRFGQIVSQVLLAQRLSVTIIDNDAHRIEEAARFGTRIYFGDGTRRDVLTAAGAGEATLILICVNDKAAATRIAELALASFPEARVLSRAYDRRHAIELMNAGVLLPVRETFEAALMLGRLALEAAGLSDRAVAETIEDVRDRDTERLSVQARDGLTAGRDLLVSRVTPEPLIAPDRSAVRLDREGAPGSTDTAAQPLPVDDAAH